MELPRAIEKRIIKYFFYQEKKHFFFKKRKFKSFFNGHNKEKKIISAIPKVNSIVLRLKESYYATQ